MNLPDEVYRDHRITYFRNSRSAAIYAGRSILALTIIGRDEGEEPADLRARALAAIDAHLADHDG